MSLTTLPMPSRLPVLPAKVRRDPLAYLMERCQPDRAGMLRAETYLLAGFLMEPGDAAAVWVKWARAKGLSVDAQAVERRMREAVARLRQPSASRRL